MNGPVNPILPVVGVDSKEWDGRPARFPISVGMWKFKVQILGDDVYLDPITADDVKRIASRALDRLNGFRGHEVAEDDNFQDALGWFEDARDHGEVDDFDEAMVRLYDWGDEQRVVIS